MARPLKAITIATPCWTHHASDKTGRLAAPARHVDESS